MCSQLQIIVCMLMIITVICRQCKKMALEIFCVRACVCVWKQTLVFTSAFKGPWQSHYRCVLHVTWSCFNKQTNKQKRNVTLPSKPWDFSASAEDRLLWISVCLATCRVMRAHWCLKADIRISLGYLSAYRLIALSGLLSPQSMIHPIHLHLVI